MNRRHFIAAAGATALLSILAGCKTEPSGEKFVGHWFSDNGRYPPTLVHIERNDDTFLFTETAWNNFGKVGYRSYTVPATLDSTDNILVVGDTTRIAYKEADDEIVSNSLRARRITESEYLKKVSSQQQKP